MVATAGHKKARTIGISTENRCNRCDIGKMGAPMEGVIAENSFASTQGFPLSIVDLAEQISNGFPHGAKMHRDMRSIRYQSP